VSDLDVETSGRPELSGQMIMVHNADAIIAERGEKCKEGGGKGVDWVCMASTPSIGQIQGPSKFGRTCASIGQNAPGPIDVVL
jgi:hypothetical protein